MYILRKIFYIIPIFTIMIFLLSNCSSKEVLPPSSPSEEAAAQRTGNLEGTVALQSWEREWQNTVMKAKKEGRVLVYTSAGISVRQDLTRAMKDKFGITLDWVSGRGAETVAKIVAERRAGLFLADMYISGVSQAIATLKPIGAIDPVEPTLILPEVKDPKMWWQGKLPLIGEGAMVFSYTANHSNPIAFNSQMVKKEEIASYYDLLQPKWKGKIIWNDPTTPGSGGSFFTIASLRILGLDYFREMAKLEPAFTRDERLQVDWIAKGKYPVAFCPSADNVEEYIKAGAQITEHTPKEGSYVTSSGGNILLLNKAPHTEATRVLINFLLSKEGQDLWTKNEGVQSARVDASLEGLRPENLRRPGMAYVSGDEEEIMQSKAKYRDIAREIFGHLIK